MFGFPCVFASAGAVACGVSTLAWPRKAALAIKVRWGGASVRLASATPGLSIAGPIASAFGCASWHKNM